MLKERKEKLFEDCRKYIKSASKIDEIKDAFNFAKKYHGNQLRKSGELFLIHPVETAIIIASWKLDYTVIQAALLHDVVEDTDAKTKDVEEAFGTEVADMVAAVTKISEVASVNKRKADEMYLKQIYLSLSSSPYASYVKVADRLHNMRTLQHLTHNKQKLISQETLDVYIPLANKIGIFNERTELEDLCFKYLHPEEFIKINDLRNKIIDETKKDIKVLKSEIKDNLNREGINVKLSHRTKTNYSIFKKLTNKGKTLAEIHDINAIRIICKSVSECYQILGMIHQRYIYSRGTFKDYISVRKRNLYSSLHTCIKYNGHIIEVQIRTEEMEKVANYGIAAYWKYKAKGEEKNLDEINLISNDDLNIENKTIEQIKQELHYSRITVLDKNGKKYSLNYDSTVLDFAFKVDKEKAPYLWKALINNRETKIFTTLQSGDVIEPIYKNHIKLNKSWKNLARSETTKYLIQEFLSSKHIDQSRKYNDIYEIRKMLSKVSNKYISSLKMNRRISELGINIGLLERYLAEGKLKTKDISMILSIDIPTYKKAMQNLNKKVNQIIKDESEILLPFSQIGTDISKASCCNPVFGEPIVGLYVNAYKVLIHSMECEKIKQKNKRIIEANWNKKPQNVLYPTSIVIEHETYSQVLNKAINLISNHQLELIKVEYSNPSSSIETKTKITFGTPDYEMMKNFLRSLRRTNGVISVKRI